MTTTTSRGFGWRAAFIGGTSTIGISAFLGTLSSNLALIFYVSQGMSIEQATAKLTSTSISMFMFYGIIIEIFAGFIGGYVSAKYGTGHPIKQSLVSGSLWVIFLFVSYIGPSNPFVPSWNIVNSIALILLSSILGGYVFSKRT